MESEDKISENTTNHQFSIFLLPKKTMPSRTLKNYGDSVTRQRKIYFRNFIKQSKIFNSKIHLRTKLIYIAISLCCIVFYEA